MTRARNCQSLTTRTASANDRTPATGTVLTSVAAAKPSMGVTSRFTPMLPALSATESIPLVGRTKPSSETSPTDPTSRTDSMGSAPHAARVASATGRSNPDPSLGTSPGLRLIVIRRVGRGNPLEAAPERMRSRASRTAAPGRPTMVTPGSPFLA